MTKREEGGGGGGKDKFVRNFVVFSQATGQTRYHAKVHEEINVVRGYQGNTSQEMHIREKIWVHHRTIVLG